jgi:tetratricopeptide (TPR) repeat protein
LRFDLAAEDRALGLIDEIVHRYRNDKDPYVRRAVMGALSARASILGDRGRIDEAGAILDQIADEADNLPEPAAYAALATAALEQGYLAETHGDLAGALASYERLGELAGSDPNRIRQRVGSLIGRARVLNRLGRREESIELYDEVVRFVDARLAVRPLEIEEAMGAKIDALWDLGRAGEALEVAERLCEMSVGFSDPRLVARLYVKTSWLLSRMGRPEDALVSLDQVARDLEKRDDPPARAAFVHLSLARARVLELSGRRPDALQLCADIVARFGADRGTEIQHMVADMNEMLRARVD